MPGDVTLLLNRVGQGELQAANQLFRLVESELRAIAARLRSGFDPGMDAPVTLLVNDAFLRLAGPDIAPADRREFFRFAAVKIHNLLVEIHRRERAEKRGGGMARVAEIPDDLYAGAPDSGPMLVDLQDALDRFEGFAPEDALLFRVRFFLGCTFEETAEILDLSVDQAKRSFKRSKTWLKHALKDYTDDS